MTSSVDIALVRGPEESRLTHPVPPLGLLYVAAALEQQGYRVAVVDAPGEGLDQAAFLDRVRTLRPAVVGLSGMTPMRHQIARDLERVRPLCDRVVLGGVHATRFRDEALDEFPDVDALVVGEGEAPAAALMAWWNRGGNGAPPPGVVVRGQPFLEAEVPRDLDALPWPARHLVPHDRYSYIFQAEGRFTTALSSRGCPFRCTFCDKTVSGSAWRARSAEDVVNELEFIEGKFGISSVCFFDDNFTLRKKRVVAICEEILRRGLQIRWKCEARVDGVDETLAKLMARAGCHVVAFGLESGNQSSLDFLKKDQSLEAARKSIRACRKAGMETVGYVLVGIPGETPESSLNTLQFVRDAGVDFIQFSTLSPFPGTELHALATRRGWYRQTDIMNPADAERSRATLLPPGWSEQDLERTLRRLYGGFYLRPGYLARQALRAHRQGALTARTRLGLEVAKWYVAGVR